MKLLPPPSRLWALILAGPALSLTGVGMTLIVWRGGWDRSLQPTQLELLGYGLLANWILLGVVVIALASVKVKGQGPGGVSFQVDSDDDQPKAAEVVTTTRTEINPVSPDA